MNPNTAIDLALVLLMILIVILIVTMGFYHLFGCLT